MCQNRRNWRTRQFKDINNNNNYSKSVILDCFWKYLHIHYLIFSHKISMKQSGQAWLSSICKWGNWGPERLSNEPKVAQQISVRDKTQYHVFWLPGQLLQVDRWTSALDKFGLIDNFTSIWGKQSILLLRAFIIAFANHFHIPSSQRNKSKTEIQNKDFRPPESYLCVDIPSLGWFSLHSKLWYDSSPHTVMFPISYSSPLHKVFLWHLNYF